MRATKPTLMRVVGGKSYSFKADDATVCKLQWLVQFYESEIGVKVSTSAILRRAVEILTQEADDLVSFARVAPRAQEIKNEKVLIAYAANGYDAPAWASGPPPIPTSETAVFPKFAELFKHSRTDRDAASATASTTPAVMLPSHDYE